MTGFTDNKQRRYSSLQPKTKSDRRPAYKPLLNRASTACFVLPAVYIRRLSFVRACEETFWTVVFDALGGKRDGRALGKPTRRRPVLPGPAPPRRPTSRRPEPICP